MLRIGLKLLLVTTLIFIVSCLIYNGLSFKPITLLQENTQTSTQKNTQKNTQNNQYVKYRFKNDVVITVAQKNSEFVIGVGYSF